MTCLLLPPVSVNYSYTYLRQLPTLSSISSPFQQNWMEFQLPTPIRTTEKRSICRGYLILTSRPSGRNDPIYCLSKPESVTKEECQPVEFVRCYSTTELCVLTSLQLLRNGIDRFSGSTGSPRHRWEYRHWCSTRFRCVGLPEKKWSWLAWLGETTDPGSQRSDCLSGAVSESPRVIWWIPFLPWRTFQSIQQTRYQTQRFAECSGEHVPPLPTMLLIAQYYIP